LVRDKIESWLDRVQAAGLLGWFLLVALSESVADVISGREIPHPDLKQVAPSPEPRQHDRAA